MIHYRPAVVKKPKSGKWYIEFYQTNPLTGKMDRFRQTPQLNRIKDLRLRAKYAHEIEAEINLRLPLALP